jgi:hypothetical protein
MATLTKTPTGYATKDGRWTLTAITMGEGVNNNGGWSKGHREWILTDTTGQATLSRYDGPSMTVDALWRARDIIDFHTQAAFAEAAARSAANHND